MSKANDFKIIRGNWGNGEYKYNVQLFYNGMYCGRGKFCKTYNEAIRYIDEKMREANGGWREPEVLNLPPCRNEEDLVFYNID